MIPSPVAVPSYSENGSEEGTSISEQCSAPVPSWVIFRSPLRSIFMTLVQGQGAKLPHLPDLRAWRHPWGLTNRAHLPLWKLVSFLSRSRKVTSRSLWGPVSSCCPRHAKCIQFRREENNNNPGPLLHHLADQPELHLQFTFPLFLQKFSFRVVPIS